MKWFYGPNLSPYDLSLIIVLTSMVEAGVISIWVSLAVMVPLIIVGNYVFGLLNRGGKYNK